MWREIYFTYCTETKGFWYLCVTGGRKRPFEKSHFLTECLGWGSNPALPDAKWVFYRTTKRSRPKCLAVNLAQSRYMCNRREKTHEKSVLNHKVKKSRQEKLEVNHSFISTNRSDLSHSSLPFLDPTTLDEKHKVSPFGTFETYWMATLLSQISPEIYQERNFLNILNTSRTLPTELIHKTI